MESLFRKLRQRLRNQPSNPDKSQDELFDTTPLFYKWETYTTKDGLSQILSFLSLLMSLYGLIFAMLFALGGPETLFTERIILFIFGASISLAVATFCSFYFLFHPRRYIRYAFGISLFLFPFLLEYLIGC